MQSLSLGYHLIQQSGKSNIEASNCTIGIHNLSNQLHAIVLFVQDREPCNDLRKFINQLYQRAIKERQFRHFVINDAKDMISLLIFYGSQVFWKKIAIWDTVDFSDIYIFYHRVILKSRYYKLGSVFSNNIILLIHLY